MITHEKHETETDIRKKSAEQQHSLLSPNKFIPHHPKFGINPLVDAAAYLFSIMGKLKQLEHYAHLNKLHQELLQEMNAFQENIKAHGYSSEFILVARYTLAATFDDIISHTSWGNHNQWENFNLRKTLSQESASEDRFFIILERISKDPATYIDVMELMYICLSLGYKGHYRRTEFSNLQLEQITYVLYKNIRIHRGDFSKTLSPMTLKKPTAAHIPEKKPLLSNAVLVTAFIVLGLFVGLSFLLDIISKQVYEELMHIGKILLL